MLGDHDHGTYPPRKVIEIIESLVAIGKKGMDAAIEAQPKAWTDSAHLLYYSGTIDKLGAGTLEAGDIDKRFGFTSLLSKLGGLATDLDASRNVGAHTAKGLGNQRALRSFRSLTMELKSAMEVEYAGQEVLAPAIGVIDRIIAAAEAKLPPIRVHALY